MSNNRILVVDDDPGIRASIHAALIEADLEVAVACDGADALSRLPSFRPNVVLADVRMPDMDGVALLEVLRQRSSETDVILMTAYQDMPTVMKAMRLGAIEFLVKPLDLDMLLSVLNRAFEDRSLRETRQTSSVANGEIGQLVGADPSMVAVYKAMGQAAASLTTALVRGESGTGKELVARAIHEHSPAGRGPFVAVNCAAIPSNLLESELFGHVRGAFTGAVASRQGRFALAQGGSIFLDEIGDTTLEFQSKLLRVLQQREYYAVGAEAPQRTDARVIAATHRKLETMVAEGRFREDLYYRLRVLEILLPPLRERRDDIELLAAHFLARIDTDSGARTVLASDALSLLRQHAWPGNVRELEHVLTRAALTARGGVVRGDHIERALAAAPEQPGSEPPLGALAEVEREHIRRVLELTEGNRARAASILRVTAPRLRRLIQRFGLE